MRQSRTSSMGFTIIELMVVIGIIVVLMLILIPSLGYIRKQAVKTAAVVQLNTLKTGLSQYYTDFNVYPASSGTFGPITAGHGASLLAQGLLGYLPGNLDGAGTSLGDPNDFGFRVNKNAALMGGKVYGPYAPRDAENFKGPPAAFPVFIDQWGNDIIYYRSLYASNTTSLPTSGPIFGTIFNANDCVASVTPAGSATPNTTANNPFYALISSGNSPAIAGQVKGSSDFLLISAGPDARYFTSDDIVESK